MSNRHTLIALDGPVSAGKSSLADAVAQQLNILHLDTGAMYRAVALAALRRDIDPADEQAVVALCLSGQAEVSVRFQDGQQITELCGLPVDGDIRAQAVGSAASTVSRYKQVRAYLVSLQQQLSKTQSMIIDGRDIGTVVLPDAPVKIFLTASSEERARRRFEQIKDAQPDATYQDVLSELVGRDKQDLERANDPLRQAEDAVLLDTTGMTFEESVAAILRIVETAYAQ